MNCGEVLITSIDRDGTLSGYDIDMILRLNEVLDIPLVQHQHGDGSHQRPHSVYQH